MREEYLGTIMVVLFDLIIGSFIWVCTKFTIPPIAAVLTVTLTCVAAWATFKVCKYWLIRIQQKWNSKRKQ